MRDTGRFFRSEWDRVAGYACLLAGVVALAFGIAGVRDAADVVDEISYLVTGGIGAVFLLGTGATLLLSADLHDDFRKLDRVEEKLDTIHRALLAEHPHLADLAAPAPSPEPPAPSGGIRVGRARRVSAGVTGVAGALFLAGAVQVVGEADTAQLSRGVGLALAGALLAAIAGGGMVGHLKGELERRQLAVLGPWAMTEGTGEPARETAWAERVWLVDGLRLYHRDGCRALEGRQAGARSRSQLPAGTGPCGLCEPDRR
jgi:hypothetical protein